MVLDYTATPNLLPSACRSFSIEDTSIQVFWNLKQFTAASGLAAEGHTMH